MSQTDTKKIPDPRPKPEITQTEVVAKSNIFRIEQCHLHFSNGEKRIYERLRGSRGGAVMIAPMMDDNTVLLIREYAVGTDRYEIGLPKGIVEPDEDILDAANREMQEEVGYGAKALTYLKALSGSPGYMGAGMHLILAKDLYPSVLPGDEPEPIEVIPWSMDNLLELSLREDVSEARTIAALYMIREWRS